MVRSLLPGLEQPNPSRCRQFVTIRRSLVALSSLIIPVGSGFNVNGRLGVEAVVVDGLKCSSLVLLKCKIVEINGFLNQLQQLSKPLASINSIMGVLDVDL